MMKRRRKPAGRTHPLGGDRSQIIKELAAAGLSGDVIAATLKLGQNTLRREHALDLHSGRTAKSEAAKAALAAAPSKAEREQLARIEESFQSDWYSPEHGNDLFGGAMNIAEALEWCKQFKAAREPNEDNSNE